MEKMNYKEDEIKVLSQMIELKKWEKEFEDILRQNLKIDLELFPIDKLWFKEYKQSVLSENIPMDKRIENYYSFPPFNNSDILHDKNSINPNSNFVFVNKQIMENFSPSVLSNKIFNVKIIGRFNNGKMVSKIGKNLYYCFFIDNNLIKEGILMFGNIEIISINPIINEFLNSDVKIFINKFFQNIDSSSNSKFLVYHRNEFDFLIKKDEKYTSIFRKSNMKDMNIIENKENRITSPKRNFKIKTANWKTNKKYEDFKQTFIDENEVSYIIDCINEYFYSEIILNELINNKKKYQFKIFQMINKKWLDQFKNGILYNQIKEKLISENDSLKYKEIILHFINNEINLNDITKEYIPLTKINIGNKNGKEYFYFNDYQLITKRSFTEFCKIFNIPNRNKEYNTFLLDKNNIFVKYDDNCGEILYFNEPNIEHIYFLISPFHLDEIVKMLQKNGIENGLSFYGFKRERKHIKEWQLIDNNQRIGILRILNDSKNKKFNNNYIDDDDEIIDKQENEIEKDNMKNKKTNIQMNIDPNDYAPKLIKKKRYLNGKNIRGNENGEEEQFIQPFTNNKIQNTKPLKFENNNINHYNEDEIKGKNIDNNMIESIKNLRSPKKSKKPKTTYSKKIFNKSKNIDQEELESNYSQPNLEEKKNVHRSNQKININSSLPKKETERNKKNKIKGGFSNLNISKNKSETNNKKVFTKKEKKKNSLSPKSSINKVNETFKKNHGFNRNKKINQRYFSPKPRKNKYLDQNQSDSEGIDFPAPGLTGLENIGATCYMNATLQCFSNVPRFRDEILNLRNKKSNDEILSYSLREVFQNLWENKEIKYYAPYNFKKLISEMNPLFKGIAANDSKDLILFILETIHRELNEKQNANPLQNNVNNLNFMSVFNGFVSEYTNNNESIVSEEFYGYFVSVMKCCYCNVTTYNVQITNILFFPLEKVRIFSKTPYNFVNLEDCFKHYEEPELFSGADQIYCTHCKMTSNAYNQNKLIIGPKTLIINLNRGKGLEFKVGIKFEEYLNISDYLMMKEKSPFYYELIGVISHFGENNMGGHFIAYCKNSYNNRWYKFNDAMVAQSSFEEASSNGLPYVLYYSYIES